MALLESLDIPMGTPLPRFELRDPAGHLFNSAALRGNKGILVAFTCNHCPYAVAVWPRLIRLAEWAAKKEIVTVAVNPNINPDYPDDSPEAMRKKISEWKIPFPYLIDESQEVARLFKAQCTPDIYLYDGEKKLCYHGRIDDNWKDETKVTSKDLFLAINRLLDGKPPLDVQRPSMGCSIKWL